MFDAYLKVDGKARKLGTWLRELDAAVARDRAVLWFGLDLPLHLPSESRTLGPCSPDDLRRIAGSERRRARGASRFRGVIWNHQLKKWRAFVRVDGTIEVVEGFESEEEAALAYDRLAIGLGADRARLNFPDRQEAPISASELRRELGVRRKSKLTSAFRGVARVKTNRWEARIYAQGRSHRLGDWTEESAAAEAYDRAALFFFGDAARRNFPDRALLPTAPTDLRVEQRTRTKATRTSVYRGVSWVVQASGRAEFRAAIKRDGALWHIGAFDDEHEAAIAHDRVARAWFGAEAQLNLPDATSPATSLEELRAELRARFKDTTTSRYTGVSWVESEAAWRSEIRVDGVRHALGYYDDDVAAARAYDRKRRELRGEGPYNFPDEIPAAKVRVRCARR